MFYTLIKHGVLINQSAHRVLSIISIKRNRPNLYSRCWTGTSLQWRLMTGNIILMRLISFAFETTPRFSLFASLFQSNTENMKMIHSWSLPKLLSSLSPDQTIATLQRNISQHLQAQHLHAPAKRSLHLKATDSNIVGCNMLRAFGHPVATCCDMLRVEIELVRMPRRNIVAQTWPNDYNIIQHPQMLHEKIWPFQI